MSHAASHGVFQPSATRLIHFQCSHVSVSNTSAFRLNFAWFKELTRRQGERIRVGKPRACIVPRPRPIDCRFPLWWQQEIWFYQLYRLHVNCSEPMFIGVGLLKPSSEEERGSLRTIGHSIQISTGSDNSALQALSSGWTGGRFIFSDHWNNCPLLLQLGLYGFQKQ